MKWNRDWFERWKGKITMHAAKVRETEKSDGEGMKNCIDKTEFVRISL